LNDEEEASDSVMRQINKLGHLAIFVARVGGTVGRKFKPMWRDQTLFRLLLLLLPLTPIMSPSLFMKTRRRASALQSIISFLLQDGQKELIPLRSS